MDEKNTYPIRTPILTHYFFDVNILRQLLQRVFYGILKIKLKIRLRFNLNNNKYKNIQFHYCIPLKGFLEIGKLYSIV